MAGLDLENFLRLLRADVGAWASFGLITGLLGLLAWTSWGSRKALRKCLVLSVAAHGGLVIYGSSVPVFTQLLRARPPIDVAEAPAEHIRAIQVVDEEPGEIGVPGENGQPDRPVSAWDRARADEQLALADPDLHAARPQITPIVPAPPDRSMAPLPIEAAAPEIAIREPELPEDRPAATAEATPPPDRVAPGAEEVAEAPAEPRREGPADPALPGVERVARVPRTKPAPTPGDLRAGPELTPRRQVPTVDLGSSSPRPEARAPEPAPATPAPVGVAAGDPEVAVEPRASTPAAAAPGPAMADLDIRRQRPNREKAPALTADLAERMVARSTAIPPAAATLPDRTDLVPSPRLANPVRNPAAVPEVYRPRLDPDRSARAMNAGASPASEQAVERALAWLKAHQDNDGRWNGGAAKYPDGTAARGEDSFTQHCPPGEICFGECFYAEADTALTGLALLAYLGAGYTHLDGKYADVVAKGLDFLVKQQKPDGDLRGMSRAVGMYCHAMASLALCEAFALTGDARLKAPAERAVDFAVRSKSADGMAWRYLPNDSRGSDTSILGWIVMLLKSSREVGIGLPSHAQAGALTWLDKVAAGKSGGLARYQPLDVAKSKRDGEVTPTMTAEAWVCRQFLGVGGPGNASDEAARYLLGTNPGQGSFNIYFWYYGTLAMYQHGGDAWTRWNAQVRDGLVRRQRVAGHQAGSWDPDETDYGARGGRIYGTALATLTLEVYYRYLRLYGTPAAAPTLAPRPPVPTDEPVRRAGRGN